MEEKIYWHTESVEHSFKLLGSGPQGLSDAEAKARLDLYGPNALRESKPDTFIKHLLRQFESPLVYALILAAVIVVLTGKTLDGIIIAAVLIVNAFVGAIQEGRAANTLAALKSFLETTATALRNNQELRIKDQLLVPGDVILVREGEKVPADCRIIDVSSLMVSEASITGESAPVEKTVEPLKTPLLQPAEQKNMLFKGTLVTKGWAKALVVATGSNSFLGSLSEKVASIKKEIPLQTHLRELANFLILAILLLSIAIFTIGVARGVAYREMFSAVVALAVSVIPEGLPIAVTLILASGVHRMSKRRALVKKLQAVEALGHIDVLAVDKTGTITKNELTAVQLWTGNQLYSLTGSGLDPAGQVQMKNTPTDAASNPELINAALVFALSSNAAIFKDENGNWTATGDPLEAALVVAAKKLGHDRAALLDRYTLVEEISFDYKRRFHATVHRSGQKYLLAAVGATEAILELCGRTNRTAVLQKERYLSAKGLRVLAYAFKKNAKPLKKDDHPSLEFGGLVALEDQLQFGVKDAIAKLQAAGISVIMLSGDNPITARSIAEQAGIITGNVKILTGKDLDKAGTDKEITKTKVFARVTPEDKLKIIQAFGKEGKTIAMTGDGVNDAPALVAADLGLAMGKSGTEVAKEASDIVLLDDNFPNIIAAVEEGRAMFLGIKKVLFYLFSTSVAELFTICTAVFLGLPLPLLAVQILWLNLVTDGFITVALGLEPKDKNILNTPFVKPSRYILDLQSILRIVISGCAMGMIALWVVLDSDGDAATKQSIALTALAVVQWVYAFTARTEISVFRSNPFSNPWLLLSLLAVALLQVAAIYWPVLQNILHTTSLPLDIWGKILGVSMIILLVDELFKRLSSALQHIRTSIHS